MNGLDLVLGKECSPCMYTIGDIIERSKEPDFDPKKSAMLMPTAPGPCRFGMYNVLQAQLLA
ncbi:MAG: CoA activase, partial [Anaerolineae bacterium]